MIYGLPYLMLGLATLIAISRQREWTKPVAFVVLGFFAVLAVARGDVGTDTLTYETLVGVYIEETGWIGIEPGFIAYVRLAHLVTDNAVLITRGLSLVFFALILIFLWRASRDETFVLLAYFAPIYLVQMSMNGLRIGIATAAFVCAMQLFRRGRNRNAVAYLVLAISFHVSIVFAIVLMALTRIEISRAKTLFLPVLGLMAAMIVAITAQGYLEDKVTDYATIVSPGVFSGLSPVGRILIILFSAVTLPISRADKRWMLVTILTATVISYGVAINSYGGLRLLEIIASVAPSLLLMRIDPSTPLNRRFRLGLALAGLLGGLNTLRGMFASANLEGSPFVPYNFLTEAIISRG